MKHVLLLSDPPVCQSETYCIRLKLADSQNGKTRQSEQCFSSRRVWRYSKMLRSCECFSMEMQFWPRQQLHRWSWWSEVNKIVFEEILCAQSLGICNFFLVQNCRSCQSGTLNDFFLSIGMYLSNKVSFSLEWQSFKLVSKVRVDTVSVGNCYDSVDNRWWWVWGRFWTDGRRYDRRW